MSRTGVEIRVVVDGKQLDDGCFNWNSGTYGDPWTETRRNIFIDPRAATAATDAWTPSGTAGATLTRAAGTGFGQDYAARVTQGPTTGALRFGMRAVLTAGTAYRIRFKANASNSSGSWQLQYRNTITSATDQTTLASGMTIDGTVRQFDYTFTPLVSGTAAATVALINGSVAANVYLQVSEVLIELAATSDGTFFDGNSTPTASSTRFRWLANPNGSPSVKEVGTWIPIDPDDYLPEGITADEGLKIVWGRSTTVDQPQPSTCTFRVTDSTDVSYISAITIGSVVEVFADANVAGPADQPAFLDGGFESSLNGFPTGGNTDLARSTVRAASGAASARISGVASGAAFAASFAPGPLQDEGENPAAWDTLPWTGGGETWTLSLDVWAPLGVTVVVRAVLYAGPYQSAAQTILAPLATVAGTGAFQHVTVTMVPATAERWVGVNVQGYGGATWDDVDPALTWDAVNPAFRWDEFATVYVDNVAVLAPAVAPPTTILAFSGRVTDLGAAWDDAADAPVIDVTASDFLAELGNRPVGDEPWAVERFESRIDRILAAATVPGEVSINADVAATVADIPVSYHDVDRQPAAGLLTDLSQSVDAVLWSSTHIVSGPYLRIEDPAARPSMYRLAFVDGVITIEPVDFSSAPPEVQPLILSACDMLRDPVEFAIDVTDVASRVTVEWLEQTVDDDGTPAPTARRQILNNAARESAYGSRTISVSTLLTTAADATTVAERIMTRTDANWRAVGITVADADFTVPDADAANALLRLLNGVLRGGLPIQVTDMPPWNPIANPLPAYVEGGEYVFSGGGWTLALIVSRASGLGESAQWDQLNPAWQWDQFEPGMTWDDLRGVAAT